MTSISRDPGAKIRHLDACLLEDSQYLKSAGFEAFELSNEAGMPICLDEVDLRTTFCGREFAAPLMISPMTGGVERGAELNRLWATVAEHYQLPMSVGSQRIAIESGDRAGFFGIRKCAPNAFVFANLGAANLTRNNAAELALRAVDMVKANALFVHFNAMQEACQNGDTDFREALSSLEVICGVLRSEGVKVFAREVGFGLSQIAAKRFLSVGVDGIDCSGAGGTSWSKVESMCASSDEQARLGNVFAEWGIPTAQSILNVRRASIDLPLIASGGVRSGLDIAKALGLGADMVGMARPMLLAASAGEESLHRFVLTILQELRIAVFASGQTKLSLLKNSLN